MKKQLCTGLVGLFLLYLVPLANAQTREARFEEEFQKTLALANSDQFIVKFYIATPTVQTLFTPLGAGSNVNIDPQQCHLSIQDSLVTGKLPYFGSAAWTSRSQLDSITFRHVLFSRTVKIYPDGKKKSIAYQVTVVTNRNVYYLHLDILYDGTCYLYISDRQRAPISYVGQIVPLKRESQNM